MALRIDVASDVVTLRITESSVYSSVQYSMNGRPIGGPTYESPDFAARLRVGVQLTDGPVRFSAECHTPSRIDHVQQDVVIATGRGAVTGLTLHWNDGAERSATWPWTTTPIVSGAVRLTFHASAASEVSLVNAFLDGEEFYYCPTHGAASFDSSQLPQVLLPTADFLNGPHAVSLAIHVGRWQPAARAEFVIDVRNPANAISEIRPEFREIVLGINEEKVVTLLAQTCGGAPPAPYNGAADVIVDPMPNRFVTARCENGVVHVTGVAPGLASVIVIPRGSRASAFHVRVRADVGAPIAHFTTGGGVAADRAKPPVFARNLFWLTAETQPPAELIAELHRAAVNTIDVALCARIAGQDSFESWQRSWNSFFPVAADLARRNNLGLHFVGDAVARLWYDLLAPIGLPSPAYDWGPRALQQAIRDIASSGLGVFADIVDESDAVWGPTPTPQSGSDFAPAAAAAAAGVQIPADAITHFVSLIRSASPSAPPITWPALGVADEEKAARWEGPPVADFATQYIDAKIGAVLGYEFGIPMNGWRLELFRVMQQRAKYLPAEWATVGLLGLMGEFYRKRNPTATEFDPAADELLGIGTRPEYVTAQALYSAMSGATGIRAYAFDAQFNKDSRSNPQNVGSLVQTGADPFRAGTDRWYAMSAAYNLIAELERFLFGTIIDAINLGGTRSIDAFNPNDPGTWLFVMGSPSIITCARRDGGDVLLLALNLSEAPNTVLVDFDRYSGGMHGTQIRVAGATRSIQIAPQHGPSKVPFAPGEVIAWIYSPRPVGSIAAILAPAPNARVRAGHFVPLKAGADQHATVEFSIDGGPPLAPDPRLGHVWVPRAEDAGRWHQITATAHLNGVATRATSIVYVV